MSQLSGNMKIKQERILDVRQFQMLCENLKILNKFSDDAYEYWDTMMEIAWYWG